MDFYKVRERAAKNGLTEVYPDFVVGRSKDFMVRGKSFYAIWNEDTGLWSTDEYDVQRIVDRDLYSYLENSLGKNSGGVIVKTLGDYSTSNWTKFKNYISSLPDNSVPLDSKITFANTPVSKTDYVSRRLPYSMEEGSYEAYDEIISTLYSPEERAKIEWAIGSIISGDSKSIQKFIVLYGEAGTGKSTILNIIQKLFEGYYSTFDAKALGSSNNAFATEVFKSNPLVAIQHDGDLSRIEDNTKLNSIISHEEIVMNEKHKATYSARMNAFLFMGTNQPVRISDSKSGIIRRLIDVNPTGKHIPAARYQALMSRVDFELGAIAHHCLQVYSEMGKHYYDRYRPTGMMYQTDIFFNFVEENYDVFSRQDSTTLAQAYSLYKEYVSESLVHKMAKYKFREELKSYFKEYYDRIQLDGERTYHYYKTFLKEKFSYKQEKEDLAYSLSLDESSSVLDDILSECKAQYANSAGAPSKPWDLVTTLLKDIDTSKEHYVLIPDKHIVIDFDLKDSDGNKSAALNLEAASGWPPTYAEYSKSGSGIHLHYIYPGDVEQLAPIFAEGIEIKVFKGLSSLRRRVSKCNNLDISVFHGTLPKKEKKPMFNPEVVQSEKTIRSLIEKNLRKEIHPGTKPSIDFIYKILEDAYNNGSHFDVTDMRPKVLAFAAKSSNHSEYCVKLVNKMHFKSEEPSETAEDYEDDRLVFFDCEVFPNLFLINWKYEGEDQIVRMINPTYEEVGDLFKMKLVGFNNRRYDNHILYARYMGYSNEELFKLSQRIINGSQNAMFGEAYDISYADILDFSSKKQGLKKFEIELGIHHKELEFPWDQPVPEDKWEEVSEYCDNDVRATEAVFHARKADFAARQILAELSGLTVNKSTATHAAKIIFGDDKKPQDKFVYTDLSEMFEGYKFDNGKSTYKGEETGEGGYVYAEPGYYEHVALLDVASMHPTSIEQLKLFGPYTSRYSEIKEARLAIKHRDTERIKKLLNGKLEKYIGDDQQMDDLAYALKIVINIVYGLTSATFNSPFRDPRNIDNIVAKRGALFMVDLKEYVQSLGYTVAHIKTDSIKIPNADDDIIRKVVEFGKKYGYEFELEDIYEKFCLVNDAVYIAKGRKGWTAVGAQFQHPYIFKSMFTDEEITLDDLSETKAVTTRLYLDMNEGLGEDEHDYHFVGRVGRFCPVVPGAGGGLLLREKDGKYYAATGTKGYRWMEREMIDNLKKEDKIDHSYFEGLAAEAFNTVKKFVDPDILLENKKGDK